MKSVGFEIKWTGAENFRKVIHALQDNTAKILKKLAIQVMKDDTTIYDCGGQIVVGHRNGTTVIVDSDYTSVTIDAIGLDEEVVNLVEEKLMNLITENGGVIK